MADGHDRRLGAVSKDDIEDLRTENKEDRARMLLNLEKRLETQDKALARIETALFAETVNNEFHSRGVMTVMRKIDQHIDLLCSICRGSLRFITVASGLLATGLVIFAHLQGWLK